MNAPLELAHYIFMTPSTEMHAEHNEDAKCCGGACSPGECCVITNE